MEPTYGVTGARRSKVHGSVGHAIQVRLKCAQGGSGSHSRIDARLRARWYQQRRQTAPTSHTDANYLTDGRSSCSHAGRRDNGAAACQWSQATLRRTWGAQVTDIGRGRTTAACVQRDGAHGTGGTCQVVGEARITWQWAATIGSECAYLWRGAPVSLQRLSCIRKILTW